MRDPDQRWRQLLAASRQAPPLSPGASPPPPPRGPWPLPRRAPARSGGERVGFALAGGLFVAAWALAIACWPLAAGPARSPLGPTMRLSRALPPLPHPPSPRALWSAAVASLSEVSDASDAPEATHPPQDPQL